MLDTIVRRARRCNHPFANTAPVTPGDNTARCGGELCPVKCKLMAICRFTTVARSQRLDEVMRGDISTRYEPVTQSSTNCIANLFSSEVIGRHSAGGIRQPHVQQIVE